MRVLAKNRFFLFNSLSLQPRGGIMQSVNGTSCRPWWGSAYFLGSAKVFLEWRCQHSAKFFGNRLIIKFSLYKICKIYVKIRFFGIFIGKIYIFWEVPNFEYFYCEKSCFWHWNICWEVPKIGFFVSKFLALCGKCRALPPHG